MGNKPFLLNLSLAELKALLADWGQPAYRATQIEHWLYQQYATDASAMSSLPKLLRQQLAERCLINPLELVVALDSSDGYTQKALFALPDDRRIETVLMRYDKRNTICMSSQAGCAMGCVFCATGQMGFMRNLTVGEIVGQFTYFAR